MQYMGRRAFSVPSSHMTILYNIIINKSEVGSHSHCLGLGNETMIFAACLSILLHIVHGMDLHSTLISVAASMTSYGFPSS